MSQLPRPRWCSRHASDDCVGMRPLARAGLADLVSELGDIEIRGVECNLALDFRTNRDLEELRGG